VELELKGVIELDIEEEGVKDIFEVESCFYFG
jgi:hypothetical protein